MGQKAKDKRKRVIEMRKKKKINVQFLREERTNKTPFPSLERRHGNFPQALRKERETKKTSYPRVTGQIVQIWRHFKTFPFLFYKSID